MKNEIISISTMVALILIKSLVVYICWPAMEAIFKLPEITYWQAGGLYIISELLLHEGAQIKSKEN